jgi:hypothetical protein
MRNYCDIINIGLPKVPIHEKVDIISKRKNKKKSSFGRKAERRNKEEK